MLCFINNHQCLYSCSCRPLQPLRFSFNLPSILLSTHAHILLFIRQCHCFAAPSWAISHSFLSINPSQSQSSLASVDFSLELSGERVERLREADWRCCTNQCLLPHLVHKGLLSPFCFSVSLSLHPTAEICSLFVLAIVVFWLIVKRGILSGSRGSSRSWLERAEATN